MTKPRKEWTSEELETAAAECDRLGFVDAAAIVRRGYPAIAAASIQLQRGLPFKTPASGDSE